MCHSGADIPVCPETGAKLTLSPPLPSFDRNDLKSSFGGVVAEGIPGILSHQRGDGAIVYDEKAPINWPQQAIMPLAWCYAGLDPDRKYERSPEILAAIRKHAGFLMQFTNEKGECDYNSFGNRVQGVDQRLIFAWVEALRILREAKSDVDTSSWAPRIEAACRELISHRLKKLVGLRHFLGRVMGTSSNHVALYLSTIYRTGKVLNKPDLVEFVLPIARAFAANIHPDGYWDEHNDLQREGGPTPIYNTLSHCAMSLMYEWTGEEVFAQAITKSTLFHGRFSYPDGTCMDLIDERVRSYNSPMVWGLFGFSHTPEGRGLAALCLETWLEKNDDKNVWQPELLARHVENSMYWRPGPVHTPLCASETHAAALTLPALYVRNKGWALAASAMRATNAEDNAYRENPFALDRQKLISAWHPDVGLAISGSHSKNQPQASTFALLKSPLNSQGFYEDYLPCGGFVEQRDEALHVRATYRSFRGAATMRALSPNSLRVELSVDTSANQGPFAAALILRPQDRTITAADGRQFKLGAEELSKTFEELGGSFRLGRVQIKGPPSARVQWPLVPFNSYAADNKADLSAAEVRVFDELTVSRPATTFELEIVAAK